MPNLFGIDIAQEIANAFSGELVAGTLTKRTPGTRTGGQLTAGTQPAEVAHTFEGFLDVRNVRRPDQIGAQPLAVLSIVTKSINPAAVPQVNDRALLQDPEFGLITVDITEILNRDPAAALFECLVE